MGYQITDRTGRVHDLDEWITPDEAARVVGVSANTIRTWIKNTERLGKRVGKRYWVHSGQLEKVASGQFNPVARDEDQELTQQA